MSNLPKARLTPSTLVCYNRDAAGQRCAAKARREASVSDLQRIRQLVIDRRYYLSAHAEEEMWADGLERPDIEYCILRGRIEKRMTRDVRGTRYRIEGPARDERLIHVICRFHQVRDLVIITVYAL
jgi:Domain of unknown function (DUF4258)